MTKKNNNVRNSKKKLILVFSFFLICTAAIVFAALKSEYFIIKNVLVENNLFVTNDEISILANLKGKNIFLIDKNKTKQNIMMNPYIEDVQINRKFPSTVVLNVTEKKIRGVLKYKNGLINIDSQGRMVQVVDHFPNGKIPMILGVKVDKYKPNDYIIKNDVNKQSALTAAMTISDYNESRYIFYSIDVSDPFNIVLKANNGRIVKFGDWNNMEDKIALAISIVDSPSITGKSGYIQIQSDGSAIFKEDKGGIVNEKN